MLVQQELILWTIGNKKHFISFKKLSSSHNIISHASSINNREASSYLVIDKIRHKKENKNFLFSKKDKIYLIQCSYY